MKIVAWLALAVLGSDAQAGELAEMTTVEVWDVVIPNTREAREILGAYQVAVVRAEFPRYTSGADTAHLVETMGTPPLGDGGDVFASPTSFTSVAEWYHTSSYGAVELYSTVYQDVVELDTDIGDDAYSCSSVNELGGWGCSESVIVEDVLEAAESQLSGFDVDDFDAFVLLVAGYGPVAKAFPSKSFGRSELPVVITHGRTWEPNDDQVNEGNIPLKNTLIHELGHALGELRHAGAWDCDQDMVGPDVEDPDDGCTNHPYGDSLSPMGHGVRDFSAYEKRLVGWLDWTETATAMVSQTVTLTALEADADGATREIRIPANGVSTFYSVEYRSPIGLNAEPVGEGADGLHLHPGADVDGLVVRLVRADDPTFDLDTAETAMVQWLVTSDEAFYDPYRTLLVELTSSDGETAEVQITFDIALMEIP